MTRGCVANGRVALRRGLAQRGDHVLVERLADGAGLLGAVEHGDGLDRRAAARATKSLEREGPVEADLEHADLLALGDQVLDGLVRGLGAGAHDHDHALGLGWPT